MCRRRAFDKWTDDYLVDLWGQDKVIDIEMKKAAVASFVTCCALQPLELGVLKRAFGVRSAWGLRVPKHGGTLC